MVEKNFAPNNDQPAKHMKIPRNEMTAEIEADFVMVEQAPAPKYEPVIHGELKL
jgi:hypothetical protein